MSIEYVMISKNYPSKNKPPPDPHPSGFSSFKLKEKMISTPNNLLHKIEERERESYPVC